MSISLSTLNDLKQALTDMQQEVCRMQPGNLHAPPYKSENNIAELTKEFIINDENQTKVKVTVERRRVTHLTHGVRELMYNANNEEEYKHNENILQNVENSQLSIKGLKPIVDTVKVTILSENKQVNEFVKSFFEQ